MSVTVLQTIEQFLLAPSGPLILLFLAGLCAAFYLRGLSWLLSLVAVAHLYLSSIPYSSRFVAGLLETNPPLDLNTAAARARLDQGPRAIVVLGFERYHDAPEFGGGTSAAGELERLRYAALLQGRTGLPIAVIGGDRLDTGTAQADIMRRVLSAEFGATVRWADGRSRHTFDNAHFAFEKLSADGITRIYLVTHAWHMKRALKAFEFAGFEVTPAPTAFTTLTPLETGWRIWLPSDQSLLRNNRAFHEILGLLWFRALGAF